MSDYDEIFTIITRTKAITTSLQVHHEDLEHGPTLSQVEIDSLLGQINRNLDDMEDLMHSVWKANRATLEQAAVTT